MKKLTGYDKPLLIIGAGGQAKVLISMLQLLGADILGILDKDSQRMGEDLLGVCIIGDESVIERYALDKVLLVNGIGSIGDSRIRRMVYDRFTKRGYRFASVIHPSAVVANDVIIADGAQIMAGVVIQAGCRIGANAIVNTRVSLDHDCIIGAHVHISPGSVVCGGCQIGIASHIGAGATVIQNVCIGNHVLVGAASLVLRDIVDGSKVYGVPAKDVNKW